MLCDDVKRVVYFFLDGTLAEGKKKDFASHLRICPDCSTRTRIHQQLRSFVQKRLTQLCAPDHLKTRLERSLRGIRADV